jgi:16S rRNA (adenine1518-N6/adenine1519-N6)-dimethyltransferase
MSKQKKSLGQHWLTDPQVLEAITEYAEVKGSNTVLEIGPGLGTLTQKLLEQARHVIAVEIDRELARNLTKNKTDNLTVVQGDILKFDLSSLPTGYKVVANIPYYLTSNLIKVLSESSNPPHIMVLLVQKEVAQRVAAKPGQMSILAISAQLYHRAELGVVVPAELFDPPPKVDSQVIILKRHPKPLFHELDTRVFFKIVKAGFSAKRKKLSGALSGGLGVSKEGATRLLESAGIDPGLRAQNLSLTQWHQLYLAYLEV